MPYSADISKLARFQRLLIGTWCNQSFPRARKGEGGPKNPLSYNVMPLPQTKAAAYGYIVKNFRYYETVRFNASSNRDDAPYYDKNAVAVPATAPNRGGRINQLPRAVFYDQQVHFAEGPAESKVVHVENGAWLHLSRVVQQPGAFPDLKKAKPVPQGQEQPLDLTVAKQIAVPHGNSVLALGGIDTLYDEFKKQALPILSGRPVIPDAPVPYPTATGLKVPPLDVTPYVTASSKDTGYNSDVFLTRHPNAPLQQAVDIIEPVYYMHWHVTTLPLAQGQGRVINIPFEQRASDVTAYWADYWLLSTDDTVGKDREKLEFDYLAYTQTMLMEMTVNGERYVFPHVTCNTVTRKKTAKSTARAKGKR